MYGVQEVNDEQWRRAMEYVSMVSELNYMSQVVVMLYEDPTKDPFSDERYSTHLFSYIAIKVVLPCSDLILITYNFLLLKYIQECIESGNHYLVRN